MKALTICQPFASLSVAGQKLVENRTWPAAFRGPMLIHAGKSKDWMDRLPGWKLVGLPDPLPFGAIVGRVRLATCLRRPQPGQTTSRRWTESLLGRYAWIRRHPHAEGPWCWIMESIEQLVDPIPYRGAQGIFEISDKVLAEAEWRPGRTPGVCRVCNCTDLRACDGNCYWVEDDLCSACAPLWG